MQLSISISTLQGVFFSIVLISAFSIMLFSYGSTIIKDLMSSEEKNNVIIVDAKMKVDSYFTSKGYLVWDIKQEEKTKRLSVSLVKNKRIIEAKGFSISEIEKHA